MAWARFESDFTRHGKVQRVPPELRPQALALDLAAVCYSVDVLTDGFISGSMAHSLAIEIGLVRGQKHADKELAKVISELERVGLWDAVEGGWEIHDFLDYQPSAEEVKEQRKAATARKRRSRAQQRIPGGHGESHGVTTQEGHSVTERGSHSVTSRAEAPAHASRAHPHADAPVHSLTKPIDPEEQKDLALQAERSAVPANGLPFEKERLTIELLAAIGSAGDEGTPQVVRRYAAQLPEGALAKVLESVRGSKAKDRARYVVGALKGELEELAPRSPSARLRDDPEAWVRQVGCAMPPDVFEEALGELVPADEDERIRLADLAADLRSAATA
jgi:hypothetical protein